MRDGELWNLWYARVPTPDGMATEIDVVLRNHSFIRDGIVRDTSSYSILDSERKAVKRHLNWKLDRFSN